MEMRNPLLLRERREYRLAEKAGPGLFTLRSCKQVKRMPRAKQLEAPCEALRITPTALTRHYFGSPNQAMNCLFAIAGATYLTPENDENAGPRFRTQGNIAKRAFVCLTDKLEEMKGKSAPERRDELTHWLATFDSIGEEADRAFKKSGRHRVNAPTELPPKA